MPHGHHFLWILETIKGSESTANCRHSISQLPVPPSLSCCSLLCSPTFNFPPSLSCYSACYSLSDSMHSLLFALLPFPPSLYFACSSLSVVPSIALLPFPPSLSCYSHALHSPAICTLILAFLLFALQLFTF
ncbi:hypothetical protein O6H91_07G015400 [Diphasiastrum complanatum]|uniref:Uncharacterized protein n=1 Tax=Diphasiastrum complanatum TaxID=34168 RepID=A0ACC2D2R1_DIPCM|nr:hypothetical protein O6H91_07G015400 [Diphasiastrum complanatum]